MMKRLQSGFTLYELLVVIAIIAIITSLAIPNFRNWLPRQRLKQATRDVFSNMQSAKLWAIKEGSNATIQFSSAGYMIFIDNITDGTAGIPNFVYDSGEPVVVEGRWNSYGSIIEPDTDMASNGYTFDNGVIAFQPNGLPVDRTGNPAGGVLYLRNENNDRTRVTLSQAGNIRIN